ncbi:MAG: hypothetical protein J6Z43_03410 [Clostridiales bacterium]|nr:hypothetical protein [Clostridiales bacterium]
MFNRLKKVTAIVTAGALMAGTFALNINHTGKISNVVRASEILDFDSANSVNFSTILGRAVDFGIVSNYLVQTNHMETTFATNTYERIGGEDAAPCDVDLAGNAPAQFIIASMAPGSTVKFGKTYNDEDMLFTIYTTQSIVDNEQVKTDKNRFHGDLQYKILSEQDLN